MILVFAVVLILFVISALSMLTEKILFLEDQTQEQLSIQR